MTALTVYSVLQTEDVVHYPMKLLNPLNLTSLSAQSLPAQKLLINVATPVLLMQNLKLYNGTKLQIKVLLRRSTNA